jgi:beta-mannosidase
MPRPDVISLDGEWTVARLPLAEEGREGYSRLAGAVTIPAVVPGEVHLDLLRAGEIADPSVGANARAARWPEEHSWWFRTTFAATPEFRGHDRQRLVFEGIDLLGEVFLNGEPVARSDDAYTPLVVDVTRILREGENELVVRVTSGTELLGPEPDGEVNRRLRASMRSDPIHDVRMFVADMHRFLRKPAYMTYGWDWCDPLPNIGLWKGVRLEGHTDVAIDAVRLDTVLGDGAVALEGEVVLDNLQVWAERDVVVEVRVLTPEGTEIAQRVELLARAGLVHVPLRIEIPDARLWWPNGMGDQPLYRVVATVATERGETDRLEQRVGLRTVEIDRSPTEDGSRFCVRVNGQDVFCRGGDMAPLDLIPARVTPARYRAFVAQARDAHFTMLRVNGVGLYESDDFYDACDEAGILLWQDFTFACAIYPDADPAFMERVRGEAIANIRRLRSHPSLALWVGNNEVTNAWNQDLVPEGASHGQAIFTRLLSELCRELDPARPYWPASPYGGADPQDPTSGDLHGWDFTVKLAEWDATVDGLRGRFYSEYFAPHSTPVLDSVREYTGSENPRVGSDEWRIHTNTYNAYGGGGLAPETGIAWHYGADEERPFEEHIRLGQLAQARSVGSALEALRFRKLDPVDDCEGALMWSFNDMWGETGWSILDAYDRRKVGYYWARRAARPVKVLVRRRGDDLVTRVVNDTLATPDVTVTTGWRRLDGGSAELEEHRVTLPANGVVTVDVTPADAGRDPREWIFAATLSGSDVEDDQSIWYSVPLREATLSAPEIRVTSVDGGVELASDVYVHAAHVNDGGRRIFADNHVELLPGVPVRVPLDPSADPATSRALPWVPGWV